MAYIGNKPTVGNFQICDAISVVNGQAAYTMQVGSVNVIPQSANHMIVSLNGTIQKPNSSFTVSSSTITFSSNLSTGDVIDFIQILGDVLDLGVPSDATVTSAKIVDDSVTLAKMASGTDGNIISYDASGNPVAVATGSSGQVLTSAGAGSPPTFADAGGDFVKITTTTISSSVSSVSVDGHFSSTYKNYQIVGTGLIFSDSYFSGTSQGLKARVRQSNADKTDGQYIWTINRSIAYFNGNLNDNNDGAYNSDHFKIIGRNNSGNQFTGNFYMNVYDPLGTSYRKAINWQTSSIETVDNSTGNLGFFSENGSTVYRGNTTALSGFTFFPASGNLTGGTITIYGLKQ